VTRERWFGATGRRVPEIAREGDFDLGDALVLDSVEDEAALRAAHEAGRPVVVRARTADEVRHALSRPEVSSALGDDPARRDHDLTATYD
jgi:hypothetical protein